MLLEPEVIEAAAELLSHGAGELPAEDEAEHRGLDGCQTRLLMDLMDELLPFDLHEAIKSAASRLDEADYPYDDEEAGVTA